MKPQNQDIEENLVLLDLIKKNSSLGFSSYKRRSSHHQTLPSNFWPIKFNSNEINRIQIRRDSLKMQEMCQEKASKKPKPHGKSNNIFKQLKKQINRKYKFWDHRQSSNENQNQTMAKARKQWISMAKAKRKENQRVTHLFQDQLFLKT